MTDEPQNRLDRALWKLEETLRIRSSQALTRLRTAVAQRRLRGSWTDDDEFPIVRRVELIDDQSYATIERDLDLLAEQIKQTGPL